MDLTEPAHQLKPPNPQGDAHDTDDDSDEDDIDYVPQPEPTPRGAKYSAGARKRSRPPGLTLHSDDEDEDDDQHEPDDPDANADADPDPEADDNDDEPEDDGDDDDANSLHNGTTNNKAERQSTPNNENTDNVSDLTTPHRPSRSQSGKLRPSRLSNSPSTAAPTLQSLGATHHGPAQQQEQPQPSQTEPTTDSVVEPPSKRAQLSQHGGQGSTSASTSNSTSNTTVHSGSDRTTDTDIDALWAEMSAGATYHPPHAARDPAAAADAAVSAWLSASAGVAAGVRAPAAGAAMPRLADLEAAEEARRCADRASRPRARRTGLERVLGTLRGDRAPAADGNAGGGPAHGQSVMGGSRKAWDSFKHAESDVRDELNMYKKDRSRYTDRVAFLQRTDVREWEFEQRGKKRRR